jgi:hypothetical protein
LSEAIEAGRKQFSSEQSRIMLDFLAGSKRGTCADRGRKHTLLKAD